MATHSVTPIFAKRTGDTPHLGGDQIPTLTHTFGVSDAPDYVTEPLWPSGVALSVDEIDDGKIDTFAPFLAEQPSLDDLPKGPEDFLKEITLEGDESFQRKLREHCSEYSDIFSDRLAEKPASLKPFEINIPLELWEKDENRTPVRPQLSTKKIALKENLDEMLASGVIERSDAAYYSHPVIVTKSPGKFRTCIDDRPLSKCLTPASFPLPHIKHLVERTGYFWCDGFNRGLPSGTITPLTSHFYSIHMLCGGLSVYETALWSVSCPLLLSRADGNSGPRISTIV